MNFGVKIVDGTHIENKKRYDKYINFQKQLYGNELSIKNNNYHLPDCIKYYIQHSNQSFLNIETFIFQKSKVFDTYLYKQLKNEIDMFHIKRLVVHITTGEKKRDYTEKQKEDYIKELIRISDELSVQIYLENTYHTINEMKEYFNFDKDKKIQLCFDIGHAKCMAENETFHEWLDFIKELDRSFHINFYSNKGNYDVHLPITKKTNEWKNWFNEEINYVEMAKKIIDLRHYDKESSFITETHNQFAKSNEFFLKKLIKYHSETY